MTMGQTSESMRSIYSDLRRAVGSWEVWKEVRYQSSRQAAGHFEFFASVQIALLDSVILAISRVLDTDNRTMSIPNLAEIEPRLFNSKIEQDIKDLSLNYKPTLKKIKQRRDKHIGHQDRVKDDPKDPLDVVEIEKFLDSLVGLFRELGKFLESADYVFDVRKRHKQETTKVMAVLQEDWENRSPGNRPRRYA